jgi:DNA-binding transcriptional regulator YiaG
MASSTATLAARIRRHRIRSGMTQVVFARKLGVSQQKLSDWERGKRLRAVVEAMTLVRTLEKNPGGK